MRVGSLFSGYGGLDLALRDVFGDVETAWVSDICKVDKDGKVGHYEPHRSPCSILSHRFPGAPNLGDIALVDWSTVEPVDVMTGGFPCTDVSTAGKRAGLRPGTRSGLWSHFAYAIDQLRPGLVVIENVRGLLSAEAHSDVEPCPWCMGDGTGQPPLRALGAVLGDLADIGYDAVWVGLRAADVDFCHGRFREFVAAYPQGNPWRLVNGNGSAPTDTRGQVGDVGPGLRPDEPTGIRWGQSARDDRQTLLPTPRATDGTHGGPNQRGSSGDLMLPSAVVKLLPTPTAELAGGTIEQYALRFKDGRTSTFAPLNMVVEQQPEQWGDYAAAITRQERAFGRPAPDPTETAPKGGRRLSCRFDEWLMGLPDGWITDVPGIKHNETLKACGNGVVPQQAAAAIRWLLGVIASEVSS